MTIAIAQTGAPTAVVNRSVAGFIDAVGEEPLLFARGGPNALVDNAFTHEAPSEAELQRVGSWLHGGRRAVTSNDLDVIVENLAKLDVTALSLIGGNGTMAFLNAISKRAQHKGIPLRTVGIPKTIDNDLVGVDHTPGFPSAARYLASTITDIARDHQAMSGIEKVRIVEVMGRDTGWLALAGCYHQHDPEFAADLVLTPETTFDVEQYIADVKRLVTERGRALVVVSEGVAPEFTRQPVKAKNHSQLIHGGVARVLADITSERLGFTARGEVLGTAQRCNSALVSAVDADEAYRLGAAAGTWLTGVDVPTGVVAGIDAEGAITSVNLNDVGGHVRGVPDEWSSRDPRELSSLHTWLSPLIALP